MYGPNEIAKARLELLRHTNMIGYAIDVYKELNGTDETPAGIFIVLLSNFQSSKVEKKRSIANMRISRTANSTNAWRAAWKATPSLRSLMTI